MLSHMTVNILTLKWGTKYGPEYVNRLHAAVRRHLTLDFRFLCFTDDPSDLRPEVETHPLPDFDVPPAWRLTPWLKLALFRDDLAGLRGQSLFLDLDILITGPMDDFFAFAPGRPCIIRDWEKPLQRLLRRHGAPGNSSVFRFESGRSGAILDRFMAERDRALAQYRTEVDQRYLAEALGENRAWWPSEWVVSFKRHCIPAFPRNLSLSPRLPPDARIVVFHGRPNPHEALDGYRARRAHRTCLPTPWIADHWR